MKDDFLEAANVIGNQISADAIWDKNRCNWIGASLEFLNQEWILIERALPADFYSGTSGISFFLAKLYQNTGEKTQRMTAVGAARQALSRLEDISAANNLGFFAGKVGIAYMLLQLGLILQIEEFCDHSLKILQTTTNQPLDSVSGDVIAGAAGAIPVLLAAYKNLSAQDELLAAAINLGDQIIAQAEKFPAGWSWRTTNETNSPNLTGLAHGAAGYAWALLELYRATGFEKFRFAARKGLDYERLWYNPLAKNWADLRTPPTFNSTSGDFVCSTAWCHGAPGIGLVRLRAFEILNEFSCLEEAEIAVLTTENTLRKPEQLAQTNYSLCHGIGGNAELLLMSLNTNLEGRENRKSLLEKIGDYGIDNFLSKNFSWLTGVNGGTTPGLMLGTAGIGYFYLRLWNPQAVGSILLIDPTRV